MVFTWEISMFLFLLLACGEAASAQETHRGLTRKLLSPGATSGIVTTITHIPGMSCEQECSTMEREEEISAGCCDCAGKLELIEVFDIPICVDATLGSLAHLVEAVLVEEGVNVEDSDEVTAALREFSSQEVSLSDLTRVETGQLSLVARERDLNREFAAKVKYNDKTKDLAYGIKRDHDAVASTQLGLVEHRAGRLNEVSATKTIDRNAITGLPKTISSDVHKDTAINLAAVHFVPRVDGDSVGSGAQSIVQPLVGGIGQTIFDSITG